MTRQETGIIMDILTAAYPRFYSSTTGPDMCNVIKLWADMFAHDEVALVAAAVKSVIASDEKGFPPTIGQVKAKLRLLTAKPEMTEAEAWDLVARAIRNDGLYGAAEEFEKFPPVVQRIVGSPGTLREWARMDTETVHSVVSSNFQRSYRAISAREREINALPPDVRALVQRIGAEPEPEKLTPPEKKALPAAEAKPEAEAVKPPEWFKDAVRPQRRSRDEVMAYLRGKADGDGR